MHAPFLNDVTAELLEDRLQNACHVWLEAASRSAVGRQQQESAGIHQR
jgi:hypothetical protein